MNKLICLVLAAVLALSLAACGSAPARIWKMYLL